MHPTTEAKLNQARTDADRAKEFYQAKRKELRATCTPNMLKDATEYARFASRLYKKGLYYIEMGSPITATVRFDSCIKAYDYANACLGVWGGVPADCNRP